MVFFFSFKPDVSAVSSLRSHLDFLSFLLSVSISFHHTQHILSTHFFRLLFLISWMEATYCLICRLSVDFRVFLFCAVCLTLLDSAEKTWVHRCCTHYAYAFQFMKLWMKFAVFFPLFHLNLWLMECIDFNLFAGGNHVCCMPVCSME